MDVLDPTPHAAQILVVDDIAVNCKLVTAVLDGTGYIVRSAGSGREAEQEIAEACPDLVLLDLQLPDTDGYTFARRLKADPATRSVAVIAFSAHAMERERRAAREAGCDGYITKPIDIKLFSLEIARIIEERACQAKLSRRMLFAGLPGLVVNSSHGAGRLQTTPG